MLHEQELVFLERLTFWQHLSDSERKQLIENTSVLHFKKGESVHSPENDCIGVILVKSGELRTYMLSEDGKEITLYRMNEGEICILSASCLIKNVTFDVYIDAEADTEIILINSYVFSQMQQSNVYVENFALQNTVSKFSDVMFAMEQILFLSIDKRLAAFLIDEYAKSKSPNVSLTHEQIAKYIGSAREVVTRMLKNFEKDGLVVLYRGGLKIEDVNGLRRIL